MGRSVIVIGGGGHAKVVIEALRAGAVEILGVTDDNPDRLDVAISGVPILGTDAEIGNHPTESVDLVIGIGSPLSLRRDVFDKYRGRGYRFPTVIHPAAIIASGTEIGDGTQIMAGSVVQPGTTIGVNVIVNTRASVDHDCRIGDHAHVAPGAVLCGGVTVGTGAHVGAGSTVNENVEIGAESVVASGAVVIGAVAAGRTVAGVPAEETK